MREKAVQFGKFKSLIGVLTEPDSPTGAPAVVLANAGLIHRIGPNRIYVKLARTLAAQGFPVLRFDLSGVGDSLPRPDNMPVEQFTIDDIVQAMDYLTASCGSQQFLLMGHCAGAYHSFRTAAQDQRVVGVVMMNPDGGEAEWVEFDRKRKLTSYYKNYYTKKSLRDPQLWKRVISGQIHYRNIIKNIFQNVLWNRAAAVVFRIRKSFHKEPASPADEKLFTVEGIIRRLETLDTRVLLVYSENATSLERLQTGMGKTVRQLTTAGKMQLEVIPGADHIFTPLASQTCLLQTITAWAQNVPVNSAPSAAAR